MWGELLVGFLLLLVTNEVKAWFPQLIDGLIRIAASRLPKKQRDRYVEEWRAHIEATPSGAKRLWDAVGFRIAAAKMYPVFDARVRRMVGRRRTLSTVRVLDRLLAVAIIFLIAPSLGAAAIATKLSGPGPVFYRRPTITWDGRHIAVLKFRTVTVEQNSSTLQLRARITPVGKLLQFTSFKEVPVCFDIFRGTSSFIDLCRHEGAVAEFSRAPTIRKYIELVLRSFRP